MVTDTNPAPAQTATFPGDRRLPRIQKINVCAGSITLHVLLRALPVRGHHLARGKGARCGKHYWRLMPKRTCVIYWFSYWLPPRMCTPSGPGRHRQDVGRRFQAEICVCWLRLFPGYGSCSIDGIDRTCHCHLTNIGPSSAAGAKRVTQYRHVCGLVVSVPVNVRIFLVV